VLLLPYQEKKITESIDLEGAVVAVHSSHLVVD
jgi:hypothetical protein